MNKNFAYHVTPSENLESILADGLIPAIGLRSADFGETDNAIYLFPDENALNDGLGNWLGECFEDDEQLAILRVDIEGLETISEVEWEIKCYSGIRAERIQFVRND